MDIAGPTLLEDFLDLVAAVLLRLSQERGHFVREDYWFGGHLRLE
jgi:hypothetical protein